MIAAACFEHATAMHVALGCVVAAVVDVAAAESLRFVEVGAAALGSAALGYAALGYAI